MKQHYLTIIRETDDRIAHSLDIQVMEDDRIPADSDLWDAGSFSYGGFRDVSSLVEAKFAIYRTTTMIAAYVNPDSRWYRSDMLFGRIILGLEFIAHKQRENGFFDLNDCNFYSGPDTAFCLKRLIPIFCYLRKNCASDEKCGELISRIDAILHKGADAMKRGGFHTPNHRWAIASVLYFCKVIYNDPSYGEAAEKYLLEGNDCNADGEYAERSAGNYNRINNDAMIMLAIATGDDSYFEPVIRNLRMMLTYMEPDGSVFTNNSTRQDRGTKNYPKDYYFEYLYMGQRFNIPEFLDAANHIFDLCTRLSLRHMDCAVHFMNCPGLISFEHEGSGIPADYRRFYTDSNIVRGRNGRYSYSVINKCPNFLYFQSGTLTCGFKIGASFCEHRAFVSETMEAFKADNVPAERSDIEGHGAVWFHLHEKKVGWYYLPFTEKPETSDWWKMDHSKRDKLIGPDMIFDIDVMDVGDGIDLNIKVSGIDQAPLRLEMSFDAGCRVETDAFTAEGIPGGGMVVKNGTLTVTKGNDAIEIGPCFGTHNFTAGKFGSGGRNANCFTVYLTDETCFEHRLHISARGAKY